MSKVIPPVWQASEAQSRLPELVDAAIDGAPQVVRRPDGREVVVVARTDVEGARPTVKDWMLDDSLKLAEDDPFFTDIKHARTLLGASLPHPYLNEDSPGDAIRAGHERGEREPESTT